MQTITKIRVEMVASTESGGSKFNLNVTVTSHAYRSVATPNKETIVIVNSCCAHAAIPYPRFAFALEGL